MSPVLRGVFLTSDDPAGTAAFYRDVANLELEQIGDEGGYVYWKIDKQGLQLAIHDAKPFTEYTHPVIRESNVTHLYFKIENQERFLEHLKSLNVTPYATDEVVVTITDPDGRKVMFGTA
jgi:predicted enzyme related to lactoylglutathione lyase